MHRAPQRHRFRCHWGIHRWHHLQGASPRVGPQVSHKASKLLDITTNFATGKEAVGAIFPDAKGKRKEDAAEDSASRDLKKKEKKGKSGKWQHQKDALVTTVNRKNPRGPPPGVPGVFDEMLKKPCPYHRGPTKHTMEECTMMRHYYSWGSQPKDDAKKKATDAQGARTRTTDSSR
jgi:hypothetical protein